MPIVDSECDRSSNHLDRATNSTLSCSSGSVNIRLLPSILLRRQRSSHNRGPIVPHHDEFRFDAALIAWRPATQYSMPLASPHSQAHDWPTKNLVLGSSPIPVPRLHSPQRQIHRTRHIERHSQPFQQTPTRSGSSAPSSFLALGERKRLDKVWSESAGG